MSFWWVVLAMIVAGVILSMLMGGLAAVAATRRGEQTGVGATGIPIRR